MLSADGRQIQETLTFLPEKIWTAQFAKLPKSKGYISSRHATPTDRVMVPYVRSRATDVFLDLTTVYK